MAESALAFTISGRVFILGFFVILILFLHPDIYASPDPRLPLVNDSDLKVEVVYDGINFPTNMAFIGPDDILVLEKDKGTVQRIVNGQMLERPLLDVPVSNKGERGMLGIASQGDENGVKNIFLYCTPSRTQDDTYDEDPDRAVLYKYDFQNGKFSNPELLLSIPADSPRNTGFHAGGEVVTGIDGNVYLVVGDMDRHRTESQNNNERSSDGTGGILRITQDGQIVDGKGILGDEHPLDMYYAYGIRNSFGMDFDPVTGKLWDTENGPGFGDEINLVEPGFNSGWEKIQGMSYQNSEFQEDRLINHNENGKYSDPEFVWNLPVGLTALKFLSSDKYGQEYENDMFVGDVNNGNLYHFDLNEDRTGLELGGDLEDKVADLPTELDSVVLGKGFGSIVDIAVGPDGYLYVLSIAQFGSLDTPLGKYESKGTIYRIVPASLNTIS